MPHPKASRTPLTALGSLRRGLAAVTSRRNAAHYVLGRAVGLVLLVLGATVCVLSARQTALAAGYAGTHGTYTVGQCHERYQAGGSGRHVGRTVTCTGTFRADGGVGGGAGGADATGDGSEDGFGDGSEDGSGGGFGTFHPGTMYRPGSRVPVQTGDGVTFTVAGWPQAWGAAAGVFLALPMLAAGTFCLLTGFGARWGRSFGDSWDGLPGGTVLRPLLLSVAGVGILGAAVFFFLQHYG